MTPQSRLGIIIGLLLLLACGLVVTEIQRGDEPVVDLPTPELLDRHAHAQPTAPPVVVSPEPTPRPASRRVAVRPEPAPAPAPQPRQTSDERTTEAVRSMLAATRSTDSTVPASRPDFQEMDVNELREHFNMPDEPTRAPARQRYTRYTVAPGDTLTAIARRELGSAARVDTLFEFNRDVMDNPNHLVVGMTLRIPISERE